MTTPTPISPPPDESVPTDPPVEIDPRIEARRELVRRASTRKRARRLVIVAIVVVVLIGTYLTINSPFLAIRHVEVRGNDHVSTAQVRAASGVRTGRPLLRTDLGPIATRIEQLPWVARAHVTRHLPNTIRIDVVEAQPVAYVRVKGRNALIDRNGQIVAVAPTPPPGTVPITGISRVGALHRQLFPKGLGAVVQAIPPALRAHVRALAVAPGSLTLTLDDGAVRLCNATTPAAKFAAAAAVIATFGGRPFQYVDVCVPADPTART
jgi:cell division protein FtsQ